jgi:hypothetical protein
METEQFGKCWRACLKRICVLAPLQQIPLKANSPAAMRDCCHFPTKTELRENYAFFTFLYTDQLLKSVELNVIVSSAFSTVTK